MVISYNVNEGQWGRSGGWIQTNGENVNANIYKYNIEFSAFKGNIS